MAAAINSSRQTCPDQVQRCSASRLSDIQQSHPHLCNSGQIPLADANNGLHMDIANYNINNAVHVPLSKSQPASQISPPCQFEDMEHEISTDYSQDHYIYDNSSPHLQQSLRDDRMSPTSPVTSSLVPCPRSQQSSCSLQSSSPTSAHNPVRISVRSPGPEMNAPMAISPQCNPYLMSSAQIGQQYRMLSLNDAPKQMQISPIPVNQHLQVSVSPLTPQSQDGCRESYNTCDISHHSHSPYSTVNNFSPTGHINSLEDQSYCCDGNKNAENNSALLESVIENNDVDQAEKMNENDDGTAIDSNSQVELRTSKYEKCINSKEFETPDQSKIRDNSTECLKMNGVCREEQCEGKYAEFCNMDKASKDVTSEISSGHNDLGIKVIKFQPSDVQDDYVADNFERNIDKNLVVCPDVNTTCNISDRFSKVESNAQLCGDSTCLPSEFSEFEYEDHIGCDDIQHYFSDVDDESFDGFEETDIVTKHEKHEGNETVLNGVPKSGPYQTKNKIHNLHNMNSKRNSTRKHISEKCTDSLLDIELDHDPNHLSKRSADGPVGVENSDGTLSVVRAGRVRQRKIPIKYKDALIYQKKSVFIDEDANCYEPKEKVANKDFLLDLNHNAKKNNGQHKVLDNKRLKVSSEKNKQKLNDESKLKEDLTVKARENDMKNCTDDDSQKDENIAIKNADGKIQNEVEDTKIDNIINSVAKNCEKKEEIHIIEINSIAQQVSLMTSNSTVLTRKRSNLSTSTIDKPAACINENARNVINSFQMEICQTYSNNRTMRDANSKCDTASRILCNKDAKAKKKELNNSETIFNNESFDVIEIDSDSDDALIENGAKNVTQETIKEEIESVTTSLDMCCEDIPDKNIHCSNEEISKVYAFTVVEDDEIGEFKTDSINSNVNTISELSRETSISKQILSHEASTPKQILSHEASTPKQILSHEASTPKQILSHEASTPKQILSHEASTPKQILSHEASTPKQILSHEASTPKQILSHEASTPKQILPLEASTPKQILPLEASTSKQNSIATTAVKISSSKDLKNNKGKKLKRKALVAFDQEEFEFGQDKNSLKFLSLRTQDMLNKKRKTVRDQWANFKGPMVVIDGATETPDNCVVINYPFEQSRMQGTKLENVTRIEISHLPSDKSVLIPLNEIAESELWTCALCGKHSSYKFLGDLFGPYTVETMFDDLRELSPKDLLESKKHCSGGNLPSASKEGLCSNRASRVSKKASECKEVWGHESCIVYSDGVFLIGSKIYGLQEAARVASQTSCTLCQEKGATIGCLNKGCQQKFHYACTQEADCFLDEENFSMLCPKHKIKKVKILEDSAMGSVA